MKKKKKLILTIMASTFFLNVGAMNLDGYSSEPENRSKNAWSAQIDVARGYSSDVDYNAGKEKRVKELIEADPELSYYLGEALKVGAFSASAVCNWISYVSGVITKTIFVVGCGDLLAMQWPYQAALAGIMATGAVDLAQQGPEAVWELTKGVGENFISSFEDRTDVKMVKILWQDKVMSHIPQWMKNLGIKTADLTKKAAGHVVNLTKKAASHVVNLAEKRVAQAMMKRRSEVYTSPSGRITVSLENRRAGKGLSKHHKLQPSRKDRRQLHHKQVIRLGHRVFVDGDSKMARRARQRNYNAIVQNLSAATTFTAKKFLLKGLTH